MIHKLRYTMLTTALALCAACGFPQSDSLGQPADTLSAVHTFTVPADSLPPSRAPKWRLPFIVSSEAVLYTGALVGLNYLWYEDYPRSPFHFINDNAEWMGMDKLGHATTSYYVGLLGYESLRWAGVREKTAVWTGGTLGLFFLTSIEVLDGFSSEWGASWGDMIANTGGAALFISQQLVWKEQRFRLKYSFWPSEYAAKRPNLLGENLLQQPLKDYNAQTYWLSANIWSFLPNREHRRFPRWLNIAVGYGANGMLGGHDNPPEFADVHRYHQFYLSVDVDLTRIRTRSKALKTIFKIVNFIKIPAPAIEFNTNSSGNVRFHWLFF